MSTAMILALTNFAQGIRLLIGILPCCAGALLLALLAWTILKVVRHYKHVGRLDDQSPAAPSDPDAPPPPPTAPGICDQCGLVFNKVFHLPDGRRLCPACRAKAD